MSASPLSRAGTPTAPRSWTTAAALALSLLACISPRAHAQAINADFPVTDGTVYATAISGNTLYLGGNFSWVGPTTGSFVAIDALSGQRESNLPRVDGSVTAAAPDGSGGWFIGGAFQNVAGVPRNRLAHVLANGSLDPWNPGVDSDVLALAYSGGVVYIGGYFANAGGQPRSGLAALDPASGLATAWNPNATGALPYVRTITVDANLVYVAGPFTGIGGQARAGLAALSATTGLANAWNPSPNGSVNALLVRGDRVYVVGSFGTIAGQPSANAAVISASLGTAAAWNPAPNASVTAVAWSVKGIVLGGGFTQVGGQPRSYVALVDTAAGTPGAWAPAFDAGATALLTTSTTVFVGGAFATVNGVQRNCLAEVNLATGVVTSWNPGANDLPLTLVGSGSTVVAGGNFSSAGGQACGNLAAIDLVRGQVLPWSPGTNLEVRALAVSGSTVYAGGQFTLAAGAQRNHVAAFDAASGALLAWNPGAGDLVDAIATSNGVVYLGGAFQFVGAEVPRNGIAAVDSATGTVTAWDPNASGATFPYVLALAVRGTTVYAGGRFLTMGGVSHPYFAAINTGTGVPAAWNPGFNGNVNALATYGGTLYAGGDFTSVGVLPRGYVAAFDLASGNATAWNPSLDGSCHAIAPAAGLVYLGGSFTSVGPAQRRGIAAVDSATANATLWGANTDAAVLSIGTTATLVEAGGAFTTMGGLSRNSLGSITTAMASALIAGVSKPAGGELLTIGTTWLIHWFTAGGTGVQSVDLYLSRTGSSGPWTLIANGLANTGRYAWVVSGPAASNSVCVRVAVRDWAGNVYSSLASNTCSIGTAIAGVQAPAAAFALAAPAPNPLRGPASVSFTVPASERVRLGVFDVQGREVQRLADESFGAGRHVVAMDASSLRPGLYFVRLQAAGADLRERCVVVR